MPTASTFFSTPPERISPAVEDRFFGRLKTGNATFKRTGHGRLDRVNDGLIDAFSRAGAQVSTVLDIGISSGVTTIELADALRAAGHDVQVTGTDRSLIAHMVELSRFVRVLAEPNGHVLQYDLCGLAIKPWRRRLDYVNGMVAVRAVLHRLLDARVRARLAVDEGKALPLVTPRLRLGRDIDLLENDITRTCPALIGRFDLVRAANILNRHYFREEQLLRAAANVRNYLHGPGAWLLLVRTNEGDSHDGSLLRMEPDGRLKLIRRYGAGSEVESLFAE